MNRKVRRVGNVDHLPEFVSLQYWLLRYGSGLLHVHCSAPLRRGVRLHTVCSFICCNFPQPTCAHVAAAMACSCVLLACESACKATRHQDRSICWS